MYKPFIVTCGLVLMLLIIKGQAYYIYRQYTSGDIFGTITDFIILCYGMVCAYILTIKAIERGDE